MAREDQKPFYLDSPPKMVDQILRKKFRLGLHPFAALLYFVFEEAPLVLREFDKWPNQPRREDLENLKASLLALRKKINKMTREFKSIIKTESGLHKILLTRWPDRDLVDIDLYQIEEILRSTEKRISYHHIFEILSGYEINKKRGKLEKPLKFRGPVNLKNLILASWAFLLLDKKQSAMENLKTLHLEERETLSRLMEAGVFPHIKLERIVLKLSDHDLGFLGNLFDWFWEKLRNHEIYKNIDPRNSSENIKSLRINFNRNRKRGWAIFEAFKHYIPFSCEIYFKDERAIWMPGKRRVYFPDNTSLV